MYISSEAKTFFGLCLAVVIVLALFFSMRDHSDPNKTTNYENPMCPYFAKAAADGDYQSQQDFNTYCKN